VTRDDISASAAAIRLAAGGGALMVKAAAAAAAWRKNQTISIVAGGKLLVGACVTCNPETRRRGVTATCDQYCWRRKLYRLNGAEYLNVPGQQR